jgi:hypothetical protein
MNLGSSRLIIPCFLLMLALLVVLLGGLYFADRIFLKPMLTDLISNLEPELIEAPVSINIF